MVLCYSDAPAAFCTCTQDLVGSISATERPSGTGLAEKNPHYYWFAHCEKRT